MQDVLTREERDDDREGHTVPSSDGPSTIRTPSCAVRGVCYGRRPPRPPPRSEYTAEEDQNQRRPEEHLSRTRGEGNLSDKRLSSPPVHWLHRMDQRKVGRIGEAGHVEVAGGIESDGVGRLIIFPTQRGGKKQ